MDVRLNVIYVVLVIFYRNLNILNRFSKNTQISNLVQNLEAKFFFADRRTDMTKLIVSLRQFANAPHYHHRHHHPRVYEGLGVFPVP
jgi:hypothetical protein